MPLDRRARVVVWVVHFAAVAVLLTTCAVYLNAPFRVDETELAWQARDGVRVHGAPVVAHAESNRELTPPAARFKAQYGLWHPPLYLYILAIAGMMGPAEGWLRGVGVLCLLASLLLIWRMAREALGPDTPRAVVALPISLALLSPLVVQGSLFVDIDNTLLATLMLLFIWEFTRPGDPLRPRRTLWLIALLTVMMWTKLTTLPMVWLSCAIAAACGEQPVRKLVAIVGIGVGAVAVFSVTFGAYCAAFDLPIRFMSEMGFGGRRDLFASVKTLSAIARSARWTIMWVSPALVALIAVVTWERVRQFDRRQALSALDVCLVLAVGMFVAYVPIGAMLGKYMMPAALMGAAFAGVRIARGWRTWRVPPMMVVVACAALLGIAVGRTPLPMLRALPGGAPLVAGLDIRAISAVSVLVLVGLTAFAWSRGAGARHGRDRLSVVGLSVALSLATITSVQTARLVLAPNDNGPLRAGYERDYRGLVATLQREVPPRQAILSLKDEGFSANRRYHMLEYYLMRPWDELIAVARRPDTWGLVDSGIYPIVPAELIARLPVARVETVGTYRIYVFAH